MKAIYTIFIGLHRNIQILNYFVIESFYFNATICILKPLQESVFHNIKYFNPKISEFQGLLVNGSGYGRPIFHNCLVVDLEFQGLV